MDDKDIEIHMENYNGKKSGLNEDITKFIQSDDSDYETQAKRTLNSLKEKSITHPAFLIARCVTLFKTILNRVLFTWAPGAIAKGVTENNRFAIIKIDPIILSSEFRDFRDSNDSSKIFTSVENNMKKYENYLLDNARNQIDFFHPALGSLPLSLCKNVFVKRNKRTKTDKYFKYRNNYKHIEFKPKSNLLKIQQYQPYLR